MLSHNMHGDDLVFIGCLWCLQVEASISKGFIRIAGTAAGGILAYGVMLKPALATRSIPLAVILLAVTFLAGCVGQTQFKVTMHLFATLQQLLCPYECTCTVMLQARSCMTVTLL